MKNSMTGLYLYASVKREQGVSDDDELYYAALEALEKEGWYDSETGELKCLEPTELEFIVHDFMIGFDADCRGLRNSLAEVYEKKHPAFTPEIMIASVFEAVRRMMG